MLNNMALTPTDLPDPVVPAISRCGILVMSAIIGVPPMSLPSASESGDLADSYCSDPSRSFSRTISRCSLGISMPTTDLPGMISTMRTLITASERAKSLAKDEIFCTFTPAAGCTSNRVTTGPGITETTSASTPKSRSFNSSIREIASRDSAE